jgi:hypothetical protein
MKAVVQVLERTILVALAFGMFGWILLAVMTGIVVILGFRRCGHWVRLGVEFQAEPH